MAVNNELYVHTELSAAPPSASGRLPSPVRVRAADSGDVQPPPLTETGAQPSDAQAAPVSEYAPCATSRIRHQRPYPVTGRAV